MEKDIKEIKRDVRAILIATMLAIGLCLYLFTLALFNDVYLFNYWSCVKSMMASEGMDGDYNTFLQALKLFEPMCK